MRESDAADPSETFPRRGNASVHEKPRQDRPIKPRIGTSLVLNERVARVLKTGGNMLYFLM
jgi:hypothetical protein